MKLVFPIHRRGCYLRRYARGFHRACEISPFPQQRLPGWMIPAGFPFRKAGNILTGEKDKRFWRRIIGLFIRNIFLTVVLVYRRSLYRYA